MRRGLILLAAMLLVACHDEGKKGRIFVDNACVSAYEVAADAASMVFPLGEKSLVLPYAEFSAFLGGRVPGEHSFSAYVLPDVDDIRREFGGEVDDDSQDTCKAYTVGRYMFFDLCPKIYPLLTDGIKRRYKIEDSAIDKSPEARVKAEALVLHELVHVRQNTQNDSSARYASHCQQDRQHKYHYRLDTMSDLRTYATPEQAARIVQNAWRCTHGVDMIEGDNLDAATCEQHTAIIQQSTGF